MIEGSERSPGQISIELEVEETDLDYPHGYVHVSDLKEISGVLGRECRMPLTKCQYQWLE